MSLNLTCPHCGNTHDQHSAPTRESATPKNGDISICIDCGACSIFDLRERCVRLPTIDEANAIACNLELQVYLAAWREVTRTRSN